MSHIHGIKYSLSSGEILFQYNTSPTDFSLQYCEPGTRKILIPQEVHYGPLDDSIDLFRDALWADTHAIHAQRLAAGCATPSGRVQTDPASLAIIGNYLAGAAAAKAIGAPYAISFTMEDNTVEQLDADGMIALGLAVQQFTDACNAWKEAVRLLIFADGATVSDLLKIDLDAGWPGGEA